MNEKQTYQDMMTRKQQKAKVKKRVDELILLQRESGSRCTAEENEFANVLKLADNYTEKTTVESPVDQARKDWRQERAIRCKGGMDAIWTIVVKGEPPIDKDWDRLWVVVRGYDADLASLSTDDIMEISKSINKETDESVRRTSDFNKGLPNTLELTRKHETLGRAIEAGAFARKQQAA